MGRKIPSAYEGDETLYDLFSHAEQITTETLLDYQYVDHHFQIVGHDRDYSNVDVHEQAMLSIKADERPTEKHAESKNKIKCFILIYKT